MGCGSSSVVAPQNFKIDYEMDSVPIGDFDTFFQTCGETLKKAEELRSGWQDTLETMYDIAAVNYLEAPAKLSDAVRVWVWALSANNGGDIKKCKPSVNTESPFLTVLISNPNDSPAIQELEDFRDALRTYIATCATGVKDLPAIIYELVCAIKEVASLKSLASAALGGLVMMDKARALGKIGKNTAKLYKGLSKLKNLVPLVSIAVGNVKSVVQEFSDIVKNADSIGKEALGKNIVFPRDIMEHFHPAEKKTPEEIESLKKQAAKKVQQKEEANQKQSKEGRE